MVVTFFGVLWKISSLLTVYGKNLLTIKGGLLWFQYGSVLNYWNLSSFVCQKKKYFVGQ